MRAGFVDVGCDACHKVTVFPLGDYLLLFLFVERYFC